MMDRDRRGEAQRSGGVRVPWSLLSTVALVGLIALAIGTTEAYLATVVLGSIVLFVGVFRRAFRASRAFCLTLANLASVYACVFLFFGESNFGGASPAALSLGFTLPLLAFLAGSFLHRGTIMGVAVSGQMRGQRRLGRIVAWLVPVFAVGVTTSVMPPALLDSAVNAILLAAMGAIAIIVFFASRDVAVFLLDTGLLFEEFFSRIARLIVPAFAFLTCFSLLVIMFASIYSVVDHLGSGMNFRIDGAVRAISFSECLYYSVVTLSTVGYGDIAPASSAARIVTAAEIICGILLLLFGFNEIFSFARGQGYRNRSE